MRRLRAILFYCLLTMAASLGLSHPVGAQGDPAKLIEYRKTVMRSLGAHASAIASVIKGEVGFWHQIVVHAVAIDGVNRTVPELFPAGTGPESGDTRAKAEIWQQQTEFTRAAQRLSLEAAGLVQAAQSGNRQAITDQFAKLGKSCGACHETFRTEKK